MKEKFIEFEVRKPFIVPRPSGRRTRGENEGGKVVAIKQFMKLLSIDDRDGGIVCA